MPRRSGLAGSFSGRCVTAAQKTRKDAIGDRRVLDVADKPSNVDGRARPRSMAMGVAPSVQRPGDGSPRRTCAPPGTSRPASAAAFT